MSDKRDYKRLGSPKFCKYCGSQLKYNAFISEYNVQNGEPKIFTHSITCNCLSDRGWYWQEKDFERKFKDIPFWNGCTEEQWIRNWTK